MVTAIPLMLPRRGYRRVHFIDKKAGIRRDAVSGRKLMVRCEYKVIKMASK